MKNAALTSPSQKITFAAARKKYYGVVRLPDGQRIRFGLDSIISKMSDSEIEAAVKAIAYVQDDLARMFEDSRFSHSPKPADEQVRETKEAALKFEGLGHICKAAINVVEIEIYEDSGSQSDSHLMSSDLVKSLLKHGEERTERRRSEEESSRMSDGCFISYQKGRAEGFNDALNYVRGLPFWRRLFGPL